MQRINKFLSKVWVFFGPGCLVIAYFILFFRANPFIGRPVWMAALTFSVFVGCCIVYLTLKEMVSKHRELQEQLEDKDKKVISLRSILDETNTLYRNKITSLEDILSEGEKQKKRYTEEIKTIEQELETYKNKAASFQASLEESLDELRSIRQQHYLQLEAGHLLPKDLPHQHKQLREQFEEKSLVLDQTRRRLFAIEGQLTALKKEQEEEKLDYSESEKQLILSIQALIEENEILEQEIIFLEKLITEKYKEKKKKSSPKLDQMLEFQLNLTE